jgi:hypothetical protein
MPEPSPEHPSVHGQLTDDINDWIEKSKKMADADIVVPLYEAVRDGKMTAAEAGAEISRKLIVRHEAAYRRL